MSSSETLYWHDYETFGADPSRDRPAQFAGLRTDLEFNPVGEPLVIYARPPRDYLPHPKACLITGITPQVALAHGLPENEFMGAIHAELAAPGTCGVGYNSLRFDDEVTRFSLYRNLFDPYAREYQHGNSRWDLIDALRAAEALRPDGIAWPQREDGHSSFRLEELTAANGIAHGQAHDALADVHATIAMARLLRERQPRLFEHLFRQRGKAAAAAMLDVEALRPVLHVSGMFGAERHHSALIAPLIRHPVNGNEVVCFDLSSDPTPLREASVEELRAALYAPRDALPDGWERPGLKSVHVNRCPVLLTPKLVDAAAAARLGLDGDRCRSHLAFLRAWREQDVAGFTARLQALVERSFPPETDPDRMLYAGGFFSERDRAALEGLRRLGPEALARALPRFEDPRLPEMLFRYRARNYPHSLNEEELERWEDFRFQRLTDPELASGMHLEAYQALLEALLSERELAAADRAVLEALVAWGDELLA